MTVSPWLIQTCSFSLKPSSMPTGFIDGYLRYAVLFTCAGSTLPLTIWAEELMAVA
jgi:ABC-type multidrug transport system permease subunit